MKSFYKSSLIFFFLFTLVNANKLRASPDEEAVFWSRQLASMNLTDFKPEPKITTFGVITEDEVGNMNKAWGDSLANISKTYEEEGFDAAKNLTEQLIDKFFCFHLGIPVGVKPSRAVAPQTFRTTPEGVLANYVGNNSDYPNDTGFALKGWVKVENYPSTILLLGRVALFMGTYSLTNKDGNVTLLDITWGFLKEDDGNLCFTIGHGSLPYSPDT
jgi:hypothetical protein